MKAKPYADRLFEYRELGRLQDAEARVALIKPAGTLGLDFDRVIATQPLPRRPATAVRGELLR